jgi:hypothetical protein
MNDEILFPEIQDPLSCNERFADVCKVLEEELFQRNFVLTAKPDGRQYWKNDLEQFGLRILFDKHWSGRGTIHVDEMLPHSCVGASTIFRGVYTQPQIDRILRFIDSYK